MSSMHMPRARRWMMQFPPLEWAVGQLREVLMGALRQGPIPEHVAFVMDGNRRFARSRGIETAEGHNQGFEALVRILEVCYKTGVRVVTIYAFSTENFQRSRREVDGLMSLAKLKLAQIAAHGDLLARYGARLRVLGDRDLMRADVREEAERVEALTAGNGRAVLNVCFCYTAREEMAGAVRGAVDRWARPVDAASRERRAAQFSERHIAQGIRSRHLTSAAEAVVARSRGASPQPGPDEDPESSASSAADSAAAASTLRGSAATEPTEASAAAVAAPDDKTLPGGAAFLDVEAIDERVLNDYMLTAGMPPLDLLVRTSGVERFSDFMLWQAHQRTDVEFATCYWPEYDLWHFLPVLLEWQWRRRREARQVTGQKRAAADAAARVAAAAKTL